MMETRLECELHDGCVRWNWNSTIHISILSISTAAALVQYPRARSRILELELGRLSRSKTWLEWPSMLVAPSDFHPMPSAFHLLVAGRDEISEDAFSRLHTKAAADRLASGTSAPSPSPGPRLRGRFRGRFQREKSNPI
jgi:hypothetical protein